MGNNQGEHTKSSSPISRRRTLGVGASVAGLSLAAAGLQRSVIAGSDTETNDEDTTWQRMDDDGSCEMMTRWKTSIEETAADWNTRTESKKYCSVPCETADETELELGQQVRIGTDENGTDGFPDAIYTIASTHQGEAVRLSQGGLERIGASESSTAIVSGQAVHPSYDTRQAGEFNDEYVEYIVGEEDRENDVFAIAPHGGFIEYGTDFQAEHIAEQYGGLGWICSGFNDGGGAFDRWHVPSTEIDRGSFPALDGLSEEPADWGVAFHGYADENIFIGGTASESDRQLVADEINDRVEGAEAVLASSDATDYGGAAPTNILNQVAPTGQTIQLEQPTHVRQTQWLAVANGVAAGLDAILE